jgi:HK97 family phage major capsid protein
MHNSITPALRELRSEIDRFGQCRPLVENGLKGLTQRLEQLKKHHEVLQSDLRRARRFSMSDASVSLSSHERAVSDDCAKYLSACLVLGANRFDALRSLGEEQRGHLLDICDGVIRASSHSEPGAARGFDILVTKSSLTSSDIPLPVVYSGEIVQLVSKYGKARRWGTVYPLGSATVKLPHLKTSPLFGFIAMSASIDEKSPQLEFIEFDPAKAGGIIRVPTELDEDSLVPLGNWLAQYMAREMAKFEDVVFFTADGSGTYSGMNGVLKSALNSGLVVTLGSGKTHPTDITLADCRAMRPLVASAALENAAYYFSPTMEGVLHSFNTLTELYRPYQERGPNGEPTLENYPVRWVEVLPVNDTGAHASQLQGAFGDLSYQYFGERGPMSVSVSREVYFTTDEIGFRPIERFAVAQMDQGAFSVLRLAAS